MKELTQSMDLFLGKTAPAKEEDPKVKEENEKVFTDIENLAKLYVKLTSAKPKLTACLTAFRIEFLNRSERKDAMADKKPTL